MIMDVPIRTETIALDQFLKLAGLVGTGGEAKVRIQGGEIRVNGEVESRRRRTLHAGDRVELEGEAGEVFRVVRAGDGGE